MTESGNIIGLTDRVRADIHRHVFDNPDREVGGVLVGDWLDDTVFVRGMIPALEAVGERAAVTFTHDAWELVHRELDRHFPGQRIVGWYHSHPGFGIFLSRDDLFIHESFFSEPWQFAYVIDPIGLEEGEFGWSGGHVVGTERRSIVAPPGFRPPDKPHQAPLEVADDPPPPWQPDGGGRAPGPDSRRTGYPPGGIVAMLLLGALVGFAVAPAFGIGDEGAGQSTGPAKRAKAGAGQGDASPRARAKPSAIPRRQPAPITHIPSSSPATKPSAPVVKEAPAPVEEEVPVPVEEAPESSPGSEAGGTSAPIPEGHFNDG